MIWKVLKSLNKPLWIESTSCWHAGGEMLRNSFRGGGQYTSQSASQRLIVGILHYITAIFADLEYWAHWTEEVRSWWKMTRWKNDLAKGGLHCWFKPHVEWSETKKKRLLAFIIRSLPSLSCISCPGGLYHCVLNKPIINFSRLPTSATVDISFEKSSALSHSLCPFTKTRFENYSASHLPSAAQIFE